MRPPCSPSPCASSGPHDAAAPADSGPPKPISRTPWLEWKPARVFHGPSGRYDFHQVLDVRLLAPATQRVRQNPQLRPDPLARGVDRNPGSCPRASRTMRLARPWLQCLHHTRGSTDPPPRSRAFLGPAGSPRHPGSLPSTPPEQHKRSHPASGRAWTHARVVSTCPFSQVNPPIRHSPLPTNCGTRARGRSSKGAPDRRDRVIKE